MSIYDKASLVLIPSGTKTSKVYSQKPVNGDGDFTFSRSTAATRVNADGNIEKETQNLLLQSNSFDTTWINVGSTLTSGQSGYNGNNAWKVEASAAVQRIEQTIGSQGVATYSMYAKAGNVSLLRVQTQTAGTDVFFDLSNGTISIQEAAAFDATITDVGNGWYRCTMSVNETISNLRFLVQRSAFSVTIGDFLYVQDAQLEQGLVARDYIETTTAAVEGGITDNVPRLDYTDSSCPALLLEPQRTNDLTHSEYIKSGVGGYTITAGSVTNNDATSPEGYTNAALFEMPFANAGFYNFTTGGSKSIGDKITLSMFAKIKSGSTTNIIKMGYGGVAVGGDRLSRFNISTGTITYSHPDADSVSIEDYGNGWYRLEQTQTCTAAGTAGAVMYADGEADFYLWGVQSELGSYATSYIPTYGTSVTRNAEYNNVQNLNTNSVTTSNSPYTIFFDLSSEPVLNVSDGNSAFLNIFSAENLTSATITPRKYYQDADGKIRFYSNLDGATIGYVTSTNKRFALLINGTTIKVFSDGALQLTYTATANHNGVGSLNLVSGSSNRTQTEYSSFLLFNSALTDAECIDLTT